MHYHSEVETTTIDSMDLERVDVVKIDIEGAEPRALAGMRETIARNKHIKIFIEYAPGVSTIGPELYDQITEMGLSVMLVGTDGRMHPIKKDELPGGHSVNMLYLYRSAV